MTQMRALIENDLILVNVHGEPAFFARVEKIVPDMKKKWWQVTLLILQLPVQKMTWTIDDNQIRGEEFTMGGVPIRLEIVEVPADDEPVMDKKQEEAVTERNAKSSQDEKEATPQKARILSFTSKK